MFNKPGDQLEYNLQHKSKSILDTIDQTESKDDQVKVIYNMLKSNHSVLAVHRSVIKKLLEKAGLPTFEQAIDKMLYQENELMKETECRQ